METIQGQPREVIHSIYSVDRRPLGLGSDIDLIAAPLSRMHTRQYDVMGESDFQSAVPCAESEYPGVAPASRGPCQSARSSMASHLVASSGARRGRHGSGTGTEPVGSDASTIAPCRFRWGGDSCSMTADQEEKHFCTSAAYREPIRRPILPSHDAGGRTGQGQPWRGAGPGVPAPSSHNHHMDCISCSSGCPFEQVSRSVFEFGRRWEHPMSYSRSCLLAIE